VSQAPADRFLSDLPSLSPQSLECFSQALESWLPGAVASQRMGRKVGSRLGPFPLFTPNNSTAELQIRPGSMHRSKARV
jgi:hypothetical protein